MSKTLSFAFVMLLLLQLAVSNIPQKQEINQENGNSKQDLEQTNYIIIRYNSDTVYSKESGHTFLNTHRNSMFIKKFRYLNQDVSTTFSYLLIESEVNFEIHFNGAIDDFLKEYFSANHDSYMSRITWADLSHFDSSKLKSVTLLFERCTNLTSVNLTNFNAPNLEQVDGMFMGCSSLSWIDLSSIQSSSLNDYGNIFSGCSNLKYININGLKFNGSPIQMNDMFKEVNSLKYISLLSVTIKDSNLETFLNHLKSKKNYFVCEDTIIIEPSETIKRLCCDFDNTMGTYNCEPTDYKIKVKYAENVNYDNGFGNSEYRNKIFYISYNGNLYGIADTFAINIKESEELDLYFSEPITNISNFFSTNADKNVEQISSIDLSGLNSPDINDMDSLFYGCNSLTYINFTNFDTKSVTNMSSMFCGCYSLVTLNLSSFNTQKVTDMSRAFYNCNSLVILDIANFYLSNVNSLVEIFTYDTNLRYLNIYNVSSNQNFIEQSGAIRENEGLFVCQKEKIISSPAKSICCDPYNIETKKCKSTNYISLTYGQDTTYEKGFKNEFRNNTELVNTETLSYEPTDKLTIPKDTNIEISFPSYVEVEVLSHFLDVNYDPFVENIVSIDLSNFITSSVKDMSFLFNGVKSVKSIDLSGLDLSSVTNMASMFENCASLEEIKFPDSLNNINDISSLFAGCSSLKSLDLSSFDTTAVTNMNSLFKGCSSLISVDLSDFNTASVTNMNSLFKACSSMQLIYIPNFDTSSVTDMNSMFAECPNLKIINIDNFNMEKIKSAENLFSESNNIKYISIYGVANTNKYITDSELKDIKLLTVCQKENIITNEDATNICCYFDYNTDKCLTSNFIGVTFKEQVEYGNGFGRKGIDFIVYKNYDKKSTSEKLSIIPNTKLTIYISTSATSLANFFNVSDDENVDKIISIELSSLNTSKITNINSLFRGCKSLKQIDLTYFRTPLVTDMGYLFSECESLEIIDLTYFDTSLVTNMDKMFCGCKSLKLLEIPNFNMSKVESASNIFDDDTGIKYVNMYNLIESSQNFLGNSYLKSMPESLIICQKNNIVQKK